MLNSRKQPVRTSIVQSPAGLLNVVDQLPTETDVRDYARRGWWISKEIVPHDLIDAAINAASRYHTGERDHPLPLEGGFSDWRPGPEAPLLRNNEFVSLQNDVFATLARLPIIGAIAARLANSDEIRLFDDQLICKPASPNETTTVGWHADHAYWGTCSSQEMLTAWIPFHDVDLERGTLVVIEGSHLWALEHSRDFNDPDLQSLPDRLAAQGHDVVQVPLTLRKGQVSFHHCWTLHGSLPNRSNLARQALAVHLQDGKNRYQPATRLDGEPVVVVNELLARRTPEGYPDFADPQVFPAIWSQTLAVSDR